MLMFFGLIVTSCFRGRVSSCLRASWIFVIVRVLDVSWLCVLTINKNLVRIFVRFHHPNR